VEGKHVESRRHRRPRQVSCCTAQGRVVSMQTACALCTRSCSTQCTGMLQTACVCVRVLMTWLSTAASPHSPLLFIASLCVLHKPVLLCSSQSNQSIKHCAVVEILFSGSSKHCNIIERSFGFSMRGQVHVVSQSVSGTAPLGPTTDATHALFVCFYF
jgi:hypothetical protein